MSLTFIKDHGEWSAYVPSPYPPNFPPGVMFTKRASDSAAGTGWYGYKETQFQADTIKIVMVPEGDRWIAQAASRDPSMLFPQGGSKVVEFDDGSVDPFAPDAFTGKVYDDVAHTLSDPAVDLVAYTEAKKVAALDQGALHAASGLHIALDVVSRADLGGMATTALAVMSGALSWPEDYAQGWISMENTRIPMPTPQDGLAIAALAGERYASIVQTARTVKDDIEEGIITATSQIDAAFAPAPEP